MTKPVYTAQAQVTGGRAHGHGSTTDGTLAVDLRPPKELGGDGKGTNPEQLFAIGYAACFGTVLTMAGLRRKLKTEDSAIDSRVMLIPNEGVFTLGVELDIALPSIDDPELAVELVRDAEQMCPYSNAIRGNIDVALTVNGVRL